MLQIVKKLYIVRERKREGKREERRGELHVSRISDCSFVRQNVSDVSRLRDVIIQCNEKILEARTRDVQHQRIFALGSST